MLFEDGGFWILIAETVIATLGFLLFVESATRCLIA